MQVESTSKPLLTVDEVEQIQRKKVATIIGHVFQLTYAAFYDKLVQEEKVKAGRFRKRHSFIQLELAGNLKTLSIFETLIETMAFFTNVVDLEAALSACLTVRDW